MKLKMFSQINKQFKIFRMVIRRITVNMMNHFFRFKKSSYMLFHNQPMFKNITTTISKWMIGLINKNISILSFINPPLPIRIIFTLNIFRMFSFNPRNMTFFKTGCIALFRFTHFSFCFFRMFISYFSNTRTFWRTIFTSTFLYMTRFSIKNSITYFAKSFWHSITSKIKAAFRCLKEQRLSYSTLLTASGTQKIRNSFRQYKYSIKIE